MMGTYVDVCVSGRAQRKELIDTSQIIFERLSHIESIMSFHDPQSELSLINRTAHRKPVPISLDLHTVITMARTLSHHTQGLFDISTPAPILIQDGQLPDHGYTPHPEAHWGDITLTRTHIFFKKALTLDLGGIAKGYAVDVAMANIPAHLHVTINAGGDLRMSDWHRKKVAIKYKSSNGINLTTLPMSHPALATSSTYYTPNNQSHIISGHTHHTVDTPFTVSVFANTCQIADALTKVVWLTPNCGELLQNMNAEGWLIDPHGQTKKIPLA
jgi:thiamine biosynthesis lipoprotein